MTDGADDASDSKGDDLGDGKGDSVGGVEGEDDSKGDNGEGTFRSYYLRD